MRRNQGDKVLFDAGPCKGTGIICGIALVEQPIVGVTYIIQIVDSDIDKNVYPYTHLIMSDILLTSTE